MAGMGEPSLVLWSNIFLCAAEVVSSVSQFSVDLSHIAEQNPVSWTSVAVLAPPYPDSCLHYCPRLCRTSAV